MRDRPSRVRSRVPTAHGAVHASSWWSATRSWITRLPRVDLLVMSGSTRSTIVRRTDGVIISDLTANRAEWEAGYKRTVARVAGHVRRAVILRDTPMFSRSVPDCLVAASGRTLACSSPRNSAVPAGAWSAEAAVDARHAWLRATDMSDRLCQPAWCMPVTSSGLLRYRDAHHLTNTYAASLAPAMYSRLRW